MGHPPKGQMVGDFWKDKAFTSRIPSRILTRMNFINKMGCLGPHDEDDVHPSDAQRVINNLLEVIDWFLESYESDQDIISQEEGEWTFDVFFNQLTPVFEDDNREWEKIVKKGNRKYRNFNVFWNAGAGFNFQPVFDIKTKNVPEKITDALSPDSLYIMTDYSKQLLQDMKIVYRDCDKKFFDEYQYFSPHKKGYTLSLDQIVPCSLFSRSELERIRGMYPDYHPSVTSSVIPDDIWHFCFMKMSVESLDVGFKMIILYHFIDNLVFWKEIVEKFSLPIHVFCALNVGGKSENWDRTHSPQNSMLWKAIHESEIDIQKKPAYWIADEDDELRNVWEELEFHNEQSQVHYFKTQWHKDT